MKRPQWLIFNNEQIKKLATITADIGIIALASLVLPAIFERFDIWQLILGLPTIIVAWIYSLRFLRNVHN